MCYWEENSSYHIPHQQCLWLLYKIGNRHSPVPWRGIHCYYSLFCGWLTPVVTETQTNTVPTWKTKTLLLFFMQFGEVESEVSTPLVNLCSAFQSTFISKLTPQQFLGAEGGLWVVLQFREGIKRHKLFPWNLLPSPRKTAANERVSYFAKSLLVSFLWLSWQLRKHFPTKKGRNIF